MLRKSMGNRTAVAVKSPGKWKFLIGVSLIAAAIIYLILSSTRATAQYFLTVGELLERKGELTGRNVRISGAVVGSSIRYDSAAHVLNFTIADIPGSQAEVDRMGGIEGVLHNAVQDESLPRLDVLYSDVKPDLLKNEAQAVITGRLNADGTFTAEELLLKCPSRYEEAQPE